MATPKTSIRPLESRITEEHLAIRAALDRLQMLCDPNAMYLALEDLREKLDDHFRHEEGERGLHAVIERTAPQYAERVDLLLAEHRDLMLEVDRLLRECSGLLNEPLARLRAATARFIERLQAHDVSETEILTDCVLQEMEDRPPPVGE